MCENLENTLPNECKRSKLQNYQKKIRFKNSFFVNKPKNY